ncbi:MAG: hypothetical protein H0W04_01685, partial [Chthoniobacterales bacterium]|nr:hypothetical protein [Chthoniobacterales bacterium]
MPTHRLPADTSAVHALDGDADPAWAGTGGFYVRILDDLEPTIPAWSAGSTRESGDDGLSAEIDRALLDWLREATKAATLTDAYSELLKQRRFRELSVNAFLAALRRAEGVVIDATQPDCPKLRLRQVRMTAREFAQLALEKSSTALTPEEIVDAARVRFGPEAIVASGRGAAASLTRQNGFFLLGPRAFGIRKHFKLPESQWRSLRDEFSNLLHQENRPISTIEVVHERCLTMSANANSYELAEIIRSDRRFIDLGRTLFALAEWGIRERQHINDLLPRVFEEAKHVLTIQQTLTRMTRMRSVSPNSIANTLQKHPSVRSFGFGYYGLTSWGTNEARVMLIDRTAVESAVRRAT